MQIINKLLKQYKEDPESLFVDQCRVLIDYLLMKNAELEREMTDFSDCWLHKDKLRDLYNQVEITDYNSCVEFVLATKKLLNREE